MLVELSIRDVVLIERLDLKFASAEKNGGKKGGNLAALTGETGAGKSILLDALGLALGSRGDSGLVRHGAAQATVSAAFEVDAKHPSHRLAERAGARQRRWRAAVAPRAGQRRARPRLHQRPAGIGGIAAPDRRSAGRSAGPVRAARPAQSRPPSRSAGRVRRSRRGRREAGRRLCRMAAGRGSASRGAGNARCGARRTGLSAPCGGRAGTARSAGR